MAISVRYPGRICLLGEHCDWAGGASLTVPLPLGIGLVAERGTDKVGIRTILDGHLIDGHWTLAQLHSWAGSPPERWPEGPLRFVPAAAACLIRQGVELVPTELLGQSDLPTGRGFSSSAAFCLAVLDALAQASGTQLPTEVLAELAYTVEHDLVGVACGRLDQYACAAGTPLFFRWAAQRPDTRTVVPRATLPLVVGAFPTPRDTPAILDALQGAHAAALDEADPTGASAAVREAVAVWASAAEAGALAVETGNLVALGAAMNTCQEVYRRGLEPTLPALRAPGLARMCTALTEVGALGAKFSGAGGDGSIVGLFADLESAAAGQARLQNAGLAAWLLPVEPS